MLSWIIRYSFLCDLYLTPAGWGCSSTPGYASVSADEHTEFTPEPSGPIMKAWNDGMLSLTKDEVLGDDQLLIGKTPDQSFVKAVQLEPTMVRLMPLCYARR